MTYAIERPTYRGHTQTGTGNQSNNAPATSTASRRSERIAAPTAHTIGALVETWWAGSRSAGLAAAGRGSCAASVTTPSLPPECTESDIAARLPRPWADAFGRAEQATGAPRGLDPRLLHVRVMSARIVRYRGNLHERRPKSLDPCPQSGHRAAAAVRGRAGPGLVTLDLGAAGADAQRAADKRTGPAARVRARRRTRARSPGRAPLLVRQRSGRGGCRSRGAHGAGPRDTRHWVGDLVHARPPDGRMGHRPSRVREAARPRRPRILLLIARS